MTRRLADFAQTSPAPTRISIGDYKSLIYIRKEGEKAGVGNKPGSVENNHSSGIAVTNYLKQLTRESVRDRRWAAPKHPSGCCALPYSPIWSCSGRGLPCRELLPVARCALTAPFHPYRPPRTTIGGIFSVALSIGSRLPGVTWRPVRRSPDFPLQQATAIVWPTPAFSAASLLHFARYDAPNT